MINTYSVKKDLSIIEAKNTLNSLEGANPLNYMFAFIGKANSWTIEDNPPTPLDNVHNLIQDWKNMISFKRVQSTDTVLAIRKIVWTSGTVYDMYDDQVVNASESNFYVITSNNKVYKCLNNNGGEPSTVEPNSSSLTPYTETDGYKWQLMYIIADNVMSKWSNEKVIPVFEITSDDGSTQWNVQQAAIPGTIDAFDIENAGSGYLVVPTVTIVGDGTGATAEVTLDNGSISSIIVTNRGSGYTHATVTISGNGGAEIRAIISPVHGHGSNAIEELGGRYIIVRALFDKDENGSFPTDIKYRQIGLLMNPTLYGTTTKATTTAGVKQMANITLTSTPSSFIQYEQIINQNNNSTATFVTYSDNTVDINNIIGTFNVGDIIIGVNSGVTATISAVSNPYLNLYSGNLVYIENRQAITRTAAQSELYKLVIAF